VLKRSTARKPQRSPKITRELEAERLAVERMGQNDEDRLRWVLEFAKKDMDKLRPGERIALGYDLRQLLPIGWAVKREQGTPVPEPALRRIHGILAGSLRTLLADDRDMSHPDAGWILPTGRDRVIRVSRKGSKQAIFTLTSEGDDETTIVRGIADLVVRAGRRLRLCARAACGQPFVATRRQEYCSNSCSQRVRNDTKKQKNQSVRRRT
jgi:hypothetical protein